MRLFLMREVFWGQNSIHWRHGPKTCQLCNSIRKKLGQFSCGKGTSTGDDDSLTVGQVAQVEKIPTYWDTCRVRDILLFKAIHLFNLVNLPNHPSRWWLQPIWKTLVKLDHFQFDRVENRNIWNHQLASKHAVPSYSMRKLGSTITSPL